MVLRTNLGDRGDSIRIDLMSVRLRLRHRHGQDSEGRSHAPRHRHDRRGPPTPPVRRACGAEPLALSTDEVVNGNEPFGYSRDDRVLDVPVATGEARGGLRMRGIVGVVALPRPCQARCHRERDWPLAFTWVAGLPACFLVRRANHGSKPTVLELIWIHRVGPLQALAWEPRAKLVRPK